MANEANIADHLRTIRARADLLPVPTVPVVYFLATAVGRHIKIGFAMNVAERIKTLQTGNSSPLILLAWQHGGGIIEREWHKRFEDRRGNGEWFHANKRMLQAIEKLQDEIAAQGGIDLTIEEWTDDDI